MYKLLLFVLPFFLIGCANRYGMKEEFVDVQTVYISAKMIKEIETRRKKLLQERKLYLK